MSLVDPSCGAKLSAGSTACHGCGAAGTATPTVRTSEPPAPVMVLILSRPLAELHDSNRLSAGSTACHGCGAAGTATPTVRTSEPPAPVMVLILSRPLAELHDSNR